MTVVKLVLMFAAFVVTALSLVEAAAVPRQVIIDNIPVQVVYDEKQEKAYQKALEYESKNKVSNEVESPTKIEITALKLDEELKPEKIIPKVEIIQAIPVKLNVKQEDAIKGAVPHLEVVKVVEEIILPEILKVENIVVPNVAVVEYILDGEEKKIVPKVSQLQNNNEKIQLNNEELVESAKHIPINNEDVVKTKIVTPDVETVTVNNGHRSPSHQELSEEYYNRVQQVVQNGIDKITADIKAYETKSGEQVNPEILQQMDATASEYLKFVRSKVDLKAATLNHQEVVDVFKASSDAFLKRVQIIGRQDAAVPPVAPTQPDNQNGFQNFFSIIANGFQSITNNLSGGQTQAGQGDETPPNPFQSFVTSFSNFFGGGSQQIGTQGDEAAGTQAPNIIVQAISNFQSGFSSLIGQGNNNAGSPATPTQGDENPAPAPAQPANPLVQAFNNIQSGISNFGANLVGQGTPAPVAVPADEGAVTPQAPPNPFSQVISNIQSGISSFGSNLGIGQGNPSTGNPLAQGDEQPVTPNGFQQFISNFGTGINQILPFGQQPTGNKHKP